MTGFTFGTIPFGAGLYLAGALSPTPLRPGPDPTRGTSTRLGPDPLRGTSTRLGPDPLRGTSTRLKV